MLQRRSIPFSLRGSDLVYRLRGLRADVFVLDEAAFVEPEMYYEVMFPIWSVERTVALLISTPPKAYSPFLDILYKTHPKTGEKLVLDYILDLVCSRCKKNKLKAKQCKHRLRRYLPDHKSLEKFQLAEILYRNTDSLNREFLYVFFDLSFSFLYITGEKLQKTRVE